MAQDRIGSWSSRIVAAAFLLALSLPSLGFALGAGTFDPGLEKRLPAPFPRLSWRAALEFPSGFERWFSDRFAFRRPLVRLANLIRVALRVSPSPKVVVGSHGWLFYGGERAVEQFRRTAPFSRSELETWHASLELRRAWLAVRGIRYVLVIPPNKETIHPEAMPSRFTRADAPSRLDQLLAHLREESAVDVLDLRLALRRARRAGPAYHRTDSHWNGNGALAAYRALEELLVEWFPGVKPLPRDGFSERRYSAPGGDLSGLLGLPDDLREEVFIETSLKRPRALPADPGAPAPADALPHTRPQAWTVPDPSLPRALVLRDSFMEGIKAYFAEQFSRSVLLATRELDPEIVEREKPDLVVEEMLERYLMMGPPGNPASMLRTLDPPEDWYPIGMDEPRRPGRPLPPPIDWQPHEVEFEANGALVARGPDPYLVLPVDALEADSSQVLRLRVRVVPRQGGGDSRIAVMQLYWVAPGTNFTEIASCRFPIVRDGQLHDYRVVPSLSARWTGEIERLRIDLPGVGGSALYEIEDVEIGGGRP